MKEIGIKQIESWLALRGQEPFPFQREAWNAYLSGKSGLIQAPTGAGKTLAAAFGPIIEFLDNNSAATTTRSKAKRANTAPITILWITPLRALAADTVESLTTAITGLGLNWSVEIRTSDTSASLRKKQKDRLPTILVTTPESLSLLLSYPDPENRFNSLQAVVVDEWHELMGSKRGVQTELGLARLRTLRPNLRVWGVSATIANVDQAAATLAGPGGAAAMARIMAPDDKEIKIESLLPETIERFPWAGHLGLRLAPAVVRQIEKAGTTLVFTNTRSQAELWFRALLGLRQDWIGKIAVHHGSIDRGLRGRIEQMLREGTLRCAVCTSSLDLGVDFWPVDQVIQIGSPKSIGRTIQRAGRSGHRPGAESRIICVPTQAIEIVEFSAARFAVAHRHVEPRYPVTMALDVLAQHVVTIAAGGGFDSEQLRGEVRGTHAFTDMTNEQWQWVIDFAERGGPSLTAYPNFARIRKDELTGKWIAANDQLARMHRMNIGTIASDGSIAVQFAGGKRLGAVEESFIAKLKPGDVFTFAGRVLEFVRVHDMTAHVRTAKRKSGIVPRWMGGRLPMSSSLAAAMRMRLDEAADGTYCDAEMMHVRPLLELQARWSRIPRLHEAMHEATKTRDGYVNYLYLFQGRLVHEGLAALIAFRLSRIGIAPITATFNDYGVELLSPKPIDLDEPAWRNVLSPVNLVEDVFACVNSSELARRHFREIARIAGLLVPTRPGGHRSTRQLQASSGLFYDVFKEFDPESLLLDQARREVLERQLEFSRLQEGLNKVAVEKLVFVKTERLSPLAFPLWAERIASQRVRFEDAEDRIERLARQLEEAAAMNMETYETQSPKPRGKTAAKISA
jgi:ATP-dependent helicase Lhr and Lhr-like helicase